MGETSHICQQCLQTERGGLREWFAVSGSNIVKLEMSASKSLLLEKTEQKQVRRQKLHLEESFVMSKQELIESSNKHCQPDNGASLLHSVQLLQNGTVPMLGIEQQKQQKSPLPAASNAAPVKPSQGGVFHIHHLAYRGCLEQNLDTGFVMPEHTNNGWSRMIRGKCKAHVSSSTFSSKCWGRGSWAWAECQHCLQFNPSPWRNKLLSCSMPVSPPLSHIRNSLTTSKQSISEEHFRKCVFFCLLKTPMRRKALLCFV